VAKVEVLKLRKLRKLIVDCGDLVLSEVETLERW